MSKIHVNYIPNCTWILDGDSFYCSHDESEIVDYCEDRLGINGHYEVLSVAFQCAECGEPVDGNPNEDIADLIAEAELMDILDK